ncbi:MAG: pyridoxal-dependent decarboxylase [Pseudomonadota bacterium]|nr:pyridoxal-dependent decarboxylase [Pseudomonadota bacterium]
MVLSGKFNDQYWKEYHKIINHAGYSAIPEEGSEPSLVAAVINRKIVLDYNPYLNTSSYVEVEHSQQELDLAARGLSINLADQTIYTHVFGIHNELVNMVAQLWNCPLDTDTKGQSQHIGSCTVGSTEACLLSGIALRERWRRWYSEKHGITKKDILGVKPNIVISSCYQAAWEKFFRFFDVEPRVILGTRASFELDVSQLDQKIDDKTIGVVGILGNHYGGQFDSIQAIHDECAKINKEKSTQVGIHIDAASGGFIAPFLPDMPAWDFRLPLVLSISASGHKYGEAVAGTGWVIWRHYKNLSEYVATEVTYLGGKSSSYSLNFSRPASSVISQYYNFLTKGMAGYRENALAALSCAAYLRTKLLNMSYRGLPRFECLDSADLPVVAMRLNPKLNLSYNDIDLQNALSAHQWYVSGYHMSFLDPENDYMETPLFSDAKSTDTMFRVVVKHVITMPMINDLVEAFEKSLSHLDKGGRVMPSKMTRDDNAKNVAQSC